MKKFGEIMKKKNKNINVKNNVFLSGIINMFFDLIKHFIKDAENIRKVKKINHFDDKFAELEHMFIKLDNKLNDFRKQVNELKNRIFLGNVIIIILLAIILINIIK